MVKLSKTPTPTFCTFPGCPKLLSSKYNLKRHIDYCHRGLRPHECSICFKRFSSKQNKIEHIRMEHSYSQTSECTEKNTQITYKEAIRIPELSNLINFSNDPDIRPFAKVRRTYMFPFEQKDYSLPLISPKTELKPTLPTLPKY